MTWASFIDMQLNRNPYTEKSEAEITGIKSKMMLEDLRWDHGPLHQVWQSNSQLDKWSFSDQRSYSALSQNLMWHHNSQCLSECWGLGSCLSVLSLYLRSILPAELLPNSSWISPAADS